MDRTLSDAHCLPAGLRLIEAMLFHAAHHVDTAWTLPDSSGRIERFWHDRQHFVIHLGASKQGHFLQRRPVSR
jgi:hypothetical protein